MKVLVTGGCGFLGSHVCELFKKKGWDVISYDNMTKFEYSRTGYKTDKVRGYNLKFLEGIGVPTIIDDIRNAKMLHKVAKGVDFIAHCAAQPAMTIAIENPQLDFEVNVQGTLNILEVASLYKIPIALCSTIHVYGNGINERIVEGKTRFYNERGNNIGINEEEPILQGGLTPLHASKRTMEIYAQAYIDTYGLKAAVFRLTGIYGPRQFGGEDHGWVANFTIRTLLGQPIKIFGTDKQVRDILYVKDAAKAFQDWYKNGCLSGIYNIGGGEQTSTSIYELLDLLEGLTDHYPKIKKLPKREGDLWWFICDIEKAYKTFGWSPKVKPKVGLKNLIDWIWKERSLFE